MIPSSGSKCHPSSTVMGMDLGLGGSSEVVREVVVPIHMLQCPRPYFWVIGSVGVSGEGEDFARESLSWVSVGEEDVAFVRVVMVSDGVVSFGQPIPIGHPRMPFCFA